VIRRPTAARSQQEPPVPGGLTRPPIQGAWPRQGWSRLPNLIEDDAANRRPQGRFAPLRGGLRLSLTAAVRGVMSMFRPGRRNGATSRTKKRDHDDGRAFSQCPPTRALSAGRMQSLNYECASFPCLTYGVRSKGISSRITRIKCTDYTERISRRAKRNSACVVAVRTLAPPRSV